MSWLFGYGSKPPQPPSDDPPSDGNAQTQPNLTKAEKKAMEAYRFDSSALERAAQAARELERSSEYFQMPYQLRFKVLHNAQHITS